jgi:hypothetical protein
LLFSHAVYLPFSDETSMASGRRQVCHSQPVSATRSEHASLPQVGTQADVPGSRKISTP